MSTRPVISVVVATYNRRPLLRELVAGLTAQVGTVAFETVVVDDASTDGTAAEVERLAALAAFPMRLVRLERNVGPASARNVGWRAAQAQLIAFTDDDCVPQPAWLSALVAGLDDHDLVQGQTLPRPDQSHRAGPFARTMRVTAEWGYYETCNMGYRRVALESANGFSEDYRRPYGEDTDLAWRLKEAGARSAFLPDAIVHHEIWPSEYLNYLRDKARMDGIVRALKVHPALRRRRGIFRNGTHPSALALAVSGVALASRRSLLTCAIAAVSALEYKRNCERYHRPVVPRSQWPVLIPLYLIADLVEIGVLTRASLRYGIVVL